MERATDGAGRLNAKAVILRHGLASIAPTPWPSELAHLLAAIMNQGICGASYGGRCSRGSVCSTDSCCNTRLLYPAGHFWAGLGSSACSRSADAPAWVRLVRATTLRRSR